MELLNDQLKLFFVELVGLDELQFSDFNLVRVELTNHIEIDSDVLIVVNALLSRYLLYRLLSSKVFG